MNAEGEKLLKQAKNGTYYNDRATGGNVFEPCPECSHKCLGKNGLTVHRKRVHKNISQSLEGNL